MSQSEPSLEDIWWLADDEQDIDAAIDIKQALKRLTPAEQLVVIKTKADLPLSNSERKTLSLARKKLRDLL